MANVILNVPNKIVDENGRIYNSIRQLSKTVHVSRERIAKELNENGYMVIHGVAYALSNVKVDIPNIPMPSLFEESEMKPEINTVVVPKVVEVEKPREDEDEYQEFRKMKEIEAILSEKYDFKLTKHKNGTRYCVALFSDVHIEQTVEKDSVLGKNEYNMDIADQRVKTFFNNLVLCLNDDRVDDLVFACLGDIINGLIHESYLAQNSAMPMEALVKAQELIYNGLRFIVKNTELKKILFVGVIGNHSRTTKKTWSSGAYKMSYEWLMYKNIETMCKSEGLPIDFVIPCADKALVNMNDGNVFLFEHGDSVRSTGAGVCGIYPALGRYALKTKRTFEQTKIYIGHFHSCCQITDVTVNGSIVGYDGFAMRNGFAWERPAQMYEVYDSNIGLLATRKIYCDK